MNLEQAHKNYCKAYQDETGTTVERDKRIAEALADYLKELEKSK